jgi:tRNA(fMet)-specific endonuclease VapC
VKYLLDTNACIAILKGTDETLRDRLDEIGPQNIAICSVVRGELLFGARKSEQVERNLLSLTSFCQGLESFPYDDKAANFYGTNRAILEKSGEKIGEADLMISSIALAYDLTVITRNRREFVRVPGLKVESW